METIDTQWTPEAAAKLRAYLARDGYEIPAGLGTEEAACSIGATLLHGSSRRMSYHWFFQRWG